MNANTKYYYQIYGITLSCDRLLPILTPVAIAPHVDVEISITQRDLPHAENDAELPKGWYKQLKADGAYYCLHLRGKDQNLAVEIAPKGQQIWITWINVPLTEVTAILIGCIIGTALRLQGKTCLHSSAIAIGQGAIAMIGAKGAGKSTTAAALAKRGYPILADDIAVLAQSGDNYFVQSGYPRLRLWKSAVNELYGSEEGLTRVFEQTDKHFINLQSHSTSSWRFESQPLPLKAIYVLEDRQPELAAPSLAELLPQIALMHLISHKYPQSLKLDKDREMREFASLGRLAATVPVKQLHRPDSLAGLSQVCDLIAEDVGAIAR